MMTKACYIKEVLESRYAFLCVKSFKMSIRYLKWLYLHRQQMGDVVLFAPDDITDQERACTIGEEINQ